MLWKGSQTCRIVQIGLTVFAIAESDTVLKTGNIGVPGQLKRQRAPQQQDVDALNGCLCGEVLQSSLNDVLKCKQAGCETIWVQVNLNKIDF